MLKRQFRLPARSRLKRPFTFSTDLFTVKYATCTLPYSRFGFIVTKAVDKRAVVRNRMRRVLRSCIEERLSLIVPGYDMLFFLKPGIIGKEREELCGEIEKFLAEKHLISSGTKIK